MTDRLSPINQPTNLPVTLAGRGKTWGRLLDEGRYLEVKRGDVCVTFDLFASVLSGRAVVVRIEEGED